MENKLQQARACLTLAAKCFMVSFFLLFGAVACQVVSTSALDEINNPHDTDNMPADQMQEGNEMAADGMDHADNAHPPRIPNGPARVSLLSPSSGEVFATSETIPVAISVTEFPLGVDGNHWHIYVDGQSARMVMGTIEYTNIGPLAPGRHEIAVFLSPDSHEELEQYALVFVEVKKAANLN